MRELVCGSRTGAQRLPRKEICKLGIHGPSLLRLTRIERGTADQIPQPVNPRIVGNATPQQGKHFAGAVFAVDRSATELENFTAQVLIRRKFEFMFAVVTEILQR